MNYQDYKKSLNQRLADKVQQELFSFRREMQTRTSCEIYDAAYQIAVKEEIAGCFSHPDYSPQAAKALLKSPDLLDEIYEEWSETEGSHKNSLRQIITDYKDYMVKTEKILSEKER
ncbi:MAG: DUF3848 domain-containing protein [Roseburia sp.]|nr:DUF3848 domain-containing protein [Roseburia sp.]